MPRSGSILALLVERWSHDQGGVGSIPALSNIFLGMALLHLRYKVVRKEVRTPGHSAIESEGEEVGCGAGVGEDSDLSKKWGVCSGHA